MPMRLWRTRHRTIGDMVPRVRHGVSGASGSSLVSDPPTTVQDALCASCLSFSSRTSRRGRMRLRRRHSLPCQRCVCMCVSVWLPVPVRAAGLETHSLPAATGGAGRLQGTVPAFVLHQWCPYHRSRGTGCCGCSTDVDVHIHRDEQHILMIRCPNFDGVSASTDEKPIRHDMTPLPGVGLCTS